MASDYLSDDVRLNAGRQLYIAVGALGRLTKRAAPSAPIFFQHSNARGIESRVYGFPEAVKLVATDFVVAVRAETRESRPRLRAAGMEPFVDAAKAMVRGADGSFSFRIRFPNGGECKPIVAPEASKLVPGLTKSYVPMRYQLIHRPTGWCSGLSQAVLPRSKRADASEELVPATIFPEIPWDAALDLPLDDDDDNRDGPVVAAVGGAGANLAIGPRQQVARPDHEDKAENEDGDEDWEEEEDEDGDGTETAASIAARAGSGKLSRRRLGRSSSPPQSSSSASSASKLHVRALSSGAHATDSDSVFHGSRSGSTSVLAGQPAASAAAPPSNLSVRFAAAPTLRSKSRGEEVISVAAASAEPNGKRPRVKSRLCAAGSSFRAVAGGTHTVTLQLQSASVSAAALDAAVSAGVMAALAAHSSQQRASPHACSDGADDSSSGALAAAAHSPSSSSSSASSLSSSSSSAAAASSVPQASAASLLSLSRAPAAPPSLSPAAATMLLDTVQRMLGGSLPGAAAAASQIVAGAHASAAALPAAVPTASEAFPVPLAPLCPGEHAVAVEAPTSSASGLLLPAELETA